MCIPSKPFFSILGSIPLPFTILNDNISYFFSKLVQTLSSTRVFCKSESFCLLSTYRMCFLFSPHLKVLKVFLTIMMLQWSIRLSSVRCFLTGFFSSSFFFLSYYIETCTFFSLSPSSLKFKSSWVSLNSFFVLVWWVFFHYRLFLYRYINSIVNNRK